jgi:hypothetical protein
MKINALWINAAQCLEQPKRPHVILPRRENAAALANQRTSLADCRGTMWVPQSAVLVGPPVEWSYTAQGHDVVVPLTAYRLAHSDLALVLQTGFQIGVLAAVDLFQHNGGRSPDEVNVVLGDALLPLNQQDGYLAVLGFAFYFAEESNHGTPVDAPVRADGPTVV